MELPPPYRSEGFLGFDFKINQKVTVDFVGMWESRRLFSAVGFSKALWEVWESLLSRYRLHVAGDFSTLSTMPSFPQSPSFL
jgi:hypothetical protein